jgi:hypothetical protein
MAAAAAAAAAADSGKLLFQETESFWGSKSGGVQIESKFGVFGQQN